MKQNQKSQTKHDSAVRKVAGGYKSQGWKGKADIPGYPTPRTIFGRQPDVIATKGAKTKIVEIETAKSYAKDIAQRNAFKRFAALNNKRSFRTKVV